MSFIPKTIFRTKTTRETLDAVALLAEEMAARWNTAQVRATTVREGKACAAKAQALSNFAEQLRTAEVQS